MNDHGTSAIEIAFAVLVVLILVIALLLALSLEAEATAWVEAIHASYETHREILEIHTEDNITWIAV